MASLVHFAVTWILLLATVLARPYGETRVPDLQLTKRQTPGDSSSVTVDLGYEVYQGISNASNGLNSFLGFVSLWISSCLRYLYFVSECDMQLPQRALCGGKRPKLQRAIGVRRCQPMLYRRDVHRTTMLQGEKLFAHIAFRSLNCVQLEIRAQTQADMRIACS